MASILHNILYNIHIPNQDIITEKEKQDLVSCIYHLKILDPACGSGAFPIGILQKLVFLLNQLDPNCRVWIDTILKAVDPLYKQSIQDSLEKESSNYIRKLDIIKRCIFGVDIQPIAIEISRLRCFLTLMVDTKADATKENLNITPLPNLEFKFVCANTLIRIPSSNNNGVENDVFQETTFQDSFLNCVQKYYNQTGNDKENTKKEIIALIQGEANTNIKSIESQIETIEKFKKIGATEAKTIAEKEKQLSPLKQKKELWESYLNLFKNKTVGFFDTPLFFPSVTNGFDIVIGNPPYIQLQKLKENNVQANLERQSYKTFEKTGDIYSLFYEKGLSISKKQTGILCYITSNKWMRASYGESLRKYFLEYTPTLLVDLGSKVFDTATVDTNILLIQNSNIPQSIKAITIKDTIKKILNLEQYVNTNALSIPHNTLDATGKQGWFIGTKAEIALKDKIETIGKPLKEWDVKIYRGVLTGLNEAFIINQDTRDKLIAEDPKSAEIIKPILRGRDIKRYGYEWAGLYMICTFPALKLDVDNYPAIKKHFINFGKEQLEQSGKNLQNGKKSRKKTGNKWFETQDQIAYYPEFEKEKVVWAETDQALNMSLVGKGFYLQKTCFMIVGNNLRYIEAVCNSKIIQKHIKNQASQLGEKGFSLTKDSVSKLPIPPITSSNQSIVTKIETLVQNILDQKEKEKEADTTSLENEIDSLVYKLYDLTEDEIKVVEGST